MSAPLNDRITRIERSVLTGTRPRSLGRNARIGAHGKGVGDAPAKIYMDSGAVGVGWVRMNKEQAEALIGKRIDELFELPTGSNEHGQIIDLPLWDLVAKLHDQPLYQLLGANGSTAVEVYDGSIYIDDLEATDEEAGHSHNFAALSYGHH